MSITCSPNDSTPSPCRTSLKAPPYEDSNSSSFLTVTSAIFPPIDLSSDSAEPYTAAEAAVTFSYAPARNTPHHRHHRGRAPESRLPWSRSRAALRQEDGQLRCAGLLPPLLRRRARQSGKHPHVLRISGCPARTRRRRHDSSHHLARRRRASARVLDRAARCRGRREQA